MFRGNFSNSTKHVLKKGLFRGKFVGKNCAKFLFRIGGIFPGEGKSRLYVLKTSGHACVQRYSIHAKEIAKRIVEKG